MTKAAATVSPKLSLKTGRPPLAPEKQAELRQCYDDQLPASIAADQVGVGKNTAHNYYARFRAGQGGKEMPGLAVKLVKVWLPGDVFRRLQRQAAGRAVKPPEAAAAMLGDMLAIDIPQFLPVRVLT